jgi:hypothetical protein
MKPIFQIALFGTISLTTSLITFFVLRKKKEEDPNNSSNMSPKSTETNRIRLTGGLHSPSHDDKINDNNSAYRQKFAHLNNRSLNGTKVNNKNTK